MTLCESTGHLFRLVRIGSQKMIRCAHCGIIADEED